MKPIVSDRAKSSHVRKCYHIVAKHHPLISGSCQQQIQSAKWTLIFKYRAQKIQVASLRYFFRNADAINIPDHHLWTSKDRIAGTVSPHTAPHFYRGITRLL